MARIRLLGTRATITVDICTLSTNGRCWVTDWKMISTSRAMTMTSRTRTST